MSINASPLAFPGKILQLLAVGVYAWAGFASKPAIQFILIGGAILTVAWYCIRLPQVIAIWHREGVRSLKLIWIQLIISSVIAAVIYGIGYGLGYFVK